MPGSPLWLPAGEAMNFPPFSGRVEVSRSNSPMGGVVYDVTDRTALVTSATGGIGASHVRGIQCSRSNVIIAAEFGLRAKRCWEAWASATRASVPMVR